MKHKRILTWFLLIATVFMLGVNVMAATSTTATVPVTLTVSNEYRAVNVTVPASLPVHVINGTVVTADNAVIKNNSKISAIQVTSVSVTDSAYIVKPGIRRSISRNMKGTSCCTRQRRMRLMNWD